MLNKKLIFLLFSIFLGLIISFFYNKEFNETFLLMSILITIIFYIIFYYLADIRNKEDFKNYYNSNFFDSKFYNTNKNKNNKNKNNKNNNNINYYLEDADGENTDEEEFSLTNNYTNNNIIEEENNIFQEETYPIINNIIEEEESDKLVNNNYIIEEEKNTPTNNYYIVEEESNISGDTIPSTTNIDQPLKNIMSEEESSLNNYVKPDLNKILLNNPIPNGTAYSPLNINISYNAQNSNNELDNNKTVSENKENSYMKNQNQNKNLGDYNDTTRIHNNSDWVYGNNAWTNNPDYYIPRKVPQPLNQLMNTKKPKENTVCPLMVNTPWTEYKSGDSEPEPYNL